MIHSSIKENWMRVEIMHSVAQKYYLSTHTSEFRERMINRDNTFPFDGDQYDVMEKESCIVGMIMAWSVITLESLVNHALAERLDNEVLAIMAIEYPSQITDKLGIAKSAKSELAKKLAILADDDKNNIKYLELAHDLSDMRNLIVHDKPFELISIEGEVMKLKHFKSRGESSEKPHKYEDLFDFYNKCDEILHYINSISTVHVIEGISFKALVRDN